MRDSLVVTGPYFHQEVLGTLVVTTDAGVQAPLSTLLAAQGGGSGLDDTSFVTVRSLTAEYVNTDGLTVNNAKTDYAEITTARIDDLTTTKLIQSVQDNIVAVARPPHGSGSYPPPGTPIIAPGINRVSQVATAGYGVFLPPTYFLAGATCLVVNDAALPCQVWGSPCYESDDTVLGAPGSVGVSVPAGTSALFFAPRTTEWDGIVSGAGSTLQSVQDNIVAGGFEDPGGIPQLAASINRVTGVPSIGKGVFLPPSQAGLTCIVLNHGDKPLQVYGQGDKVQDVSFSVGMPQLPGAGVLYVCATAGVWYGIGLGTGFVPFATKSDAFYGLTTGALPTVSADDNLVAHAGGGQFPPGAVELAKVINRIGTVASDGDSVRLMTALSGAQITVINAGACTLAVFPADGEVINARAINASVAVPAGKTSQFLCASNGLWNLFLSA